MSAKTKEYLQSLVRELCNYKTEVEWVEFKSNMDDPENIARYISALSNSATQQLFGEGLLPILCGA